MVCRKWDVHNVNGRYISSDFMLSDEKGDIIHCVAKGNVAHCFVTKLLEGFVYTFKNFLVHPARAEYKIVKRSSYEIELQGSTKVTKVKHFVGDYVRYPFELLEFTDLRPTEKNHFVDVMGYIVGIGSIMVNNKGSKTLDFTLVNQSANQLRVTLWGSLGEELLSRKPKDSSPYLLILTNMVAKYYLGLLCLSSSSATQIFDDLDIPFIRGFIGLMQKFDVSENKLLPVIEEASKSTLDEVIKYSRDGDHPPKRFKVMVEIVSVRSRNSWYNFTCTTGKCRKGVSRKEGQFWCESCDNVVSFPRPRLRMQLDVRDKTSACVVVCFDETAEELCKPTAKEILDSQEDDTCDDYTLPASLTKLVGTLWVFELRSTTFYHSGDYQSFNCGRVVCEEKVSESVVDLTQQEDTINNREPKPVPTPSKPTEQRKRKYQEGLESATDLVYVDVSTNSSHDITVDESVKNDVTTSDVEDSGNCETLESGVPEMIAQSSTTSESSAKRPAPSTTSTDE